MKKLHLLAVAPLLFGAGSAAISYANSADFTDTELSSAVTTNTSFFFKNNYQITSELELPYLGATISLVDEVGLTNRVSRAYIYNQLFSEVSIVKTSTGYAAQEYISLQNTVENRLIQNGESYVNYDSVYGNPFKSFSTLSNSQINKYFEIEKCEDSYVLHANDLAYGALTKSITNFYDDFNVYVWDPTSYNVYIEDLKLTLLLDGTPSNLEFTRIKKDRFGAAKEYITADFTSITEINTVKPVEPKLSEEQAATLKSKLDSMQEGLSEGNFTQTHSFKLGTTPVIEYSNHFALQGNPNSRLPGLMISDCELYEASYGLTYVMLILSSEGYMPYAVSPDADFSGTMSDEKFATLDECIPHVNAISTDFFSYKNGKYVFDISSFQYADVYFCAGILTALNGVLDPATSILGLYLNNYSYLFQELVFEFDSSNNLFGSLTVDVGQSELVVNNFSFSNVGTTVLENVEKIAPAVNYILNM